MKRNFRSALSRLAFAVVATAAFSFVSVGAASAEDLSAILKNPSRLRDTSPSSLREAASVVAKTQWAGLGANAVRDQQKAAELITSLGKNARFQREQQAVGAKAEASARARDKSVGSVRQAVDQIARQQSGAKARAIGQAFARSDAKIKDTTIRGQQRAAKAIATTPAQLKTVRPRISKSFLFITPRGIGFGKVSRPARVLAAKRSLTRARIGK